MKKVLLLLCFNFLLASVMAQSPTEKKSTPKDLGIAVSAGVQLPIGNFASTHIAGLGISVSPSYYKVPLFTKTKIAFTYNGGAAYYLGKKETVSGYSYTYPGYFFIHAFAGALLIASPKMSFALTGGPAIGKYDGNTQFNIGSRLELNYHLNNTLSVGPGILFMKEAGSSPLWAAALKVTRSF